MDITPEREQELNAATVYEPPNGREGWPPSMVHGAGLPVSVRLKDGTFVVSIHCDGGVIPEMLDAEENVPLIIEVNGEAVYDSTDSTEEQIDCRSEKGITEGLVDALISIHRVLAIRDMTPENVQGALQDMMEDEDLRTIREALVPVEDEEEAPAN